MNRIDVNAGNPAFQQNQAHTPAKTGKIHLIREDYSDKDDGDLCLGAIICITATALAGILMASYRLTSKFEGGFGSQSIDDMELFVDDGDLT